VAVDGKIWEESVDTTHLCGMSLRDDATFASQLLTKQISLNNNR
jgi:hypothetical protein